MLRSLVGSEMCIRDSRNNILKQFHKIGTYVVLHLIGLITFNLKEYRFLHFSLDKLPPPEELLVDINLEKKMLKRIGLFGFVYLGVFENQKLITD